MNEMTSKTANYLIVKSNSFAADVIWTRHFTIIMCSCSQWVIVGNDCGMQWPKDHCEVSALMIMTGLHKPNYFGISTRRPA